MSISKHERTGQQYLLEVMDKRENRCPACAAMAGTHIFDVNGYGIGRCATCGSMYVENMPPPQALAAPYMEDDYYDLPQDALQRIKLENKRRLRVIHQIKSEGTLLDIGCAQGFLLSEAARMGYHVCGVEPTKHNAQAVADNGIEVLNGTLEEFVAAYPDRCFDIITSLDVIEHVADPRAFLSLALTLLAEDGIIVISTPNYSGLVARMLGARDPYLTPPEHVVFLTDAGMRRLAESVGLEVFQRRTFGRLIKEEVERVIQRYLPKPMRPLHYLLRPLVNPSLSILNWLGFGLEQEVYLTHSSAAETGSGMDTKRQHGAL